jgi:hypothetical protein
VIGRAAVEEERTRDSARASGVGMLRISSRGDELGRVIKVAMRGIGYFVETRKKARNNCI